MPNEIDADLDAAICGLHIFLHSLTPPSTLLRTKIISLILPILLNSTPTPNPED